MWSLETKAKNQTHFLTSGLDIGLGIEVTLLALMFHKIESLSELF